MRIIKASCVDEALIRGLTLLEEEGLKSESRNGNVLVMPCPVMTVNELPMNRVSFNGKRNANPFFHLMEALWMLAGRNDATWLDQFVGDFSSRFSEYGVMHGAYGFRWRQHFDLEGGAEARRPDQLETAVRLLKANPDDRRVVIAMWDPMADLAADKKDIPCNTHIYLRIRKMGDVDTTGDYTREPLLDLTVCCRSNDAIWGCHGANAVHFSVLQEYLAARIGVGVGKLYQLSNNYHAYLGEMHKVWPMGLEGVDVYGMAGHIVTPIVTFPAEFDADLSLFFSPDWDAPESSSRGNVYCNAVFPQVAIPLRKSYAYWRAGDRRTARHTVMDARACDWTIAAVNWYHRMMVKSLKEDKDVG